MVKVGRSLQIALSIEFDSNEITTFIHGSHKEFEGCKKELESSFFFKLKIGLGKQLISLWNSEKDQKNGPMNDWKNTEIYGGQYLTLVYILEKIALSGETRRLQ